MDEIQIIELENHSDIRGCLYSYQDLAFEIKRLFFIGVESSNTIRGSHGHQQCWQIFVPINGKIEIEITKPNSITAINLLEGQALVVPPMNVCTIKFPDVNTRLLVLASEKFNSNDYYFLPSNAIK